MRTSRRSSSSAMVAMEGSWLFVAVGVALDWLVMEGSSALPSAGCAPCPLVSNSGMPMVNDISTKKHEIGKGRWRTAQ